MNIPRYITQITGDWLRNVSKKICAGNGIRIKEDADNRIVEADIDALKMQIGGSELSDDDPQDVGAAAAPGTGTEASRADHVHKLDVDDSLALTNGTLGVVYNSNKGLVKETGNGLGVNGDSSMKFDSNGALGVKYNTSAGLTLDSTNGLGVSVDTNSLEFSSNQLAVKCATNGGITSSSGLKLEYLSYSSPTSITSAQGAAAFSGETDTWNGASATTGVSVWICTGCSADSFGIINELFFREFTFDRLGRLYSISSEQKKFVFDITDP